MNTKALVTMTVSAFAAGAVLAADWTVEEDTRLSADKTVDTLTVNAGVTLDLNGYKLTCSALAGSGTITRTGENDDLTSPEGVVSGTYLDNGVDTELQGGSYAALFDDDFTNYGNPHRLLSGSLANGNFLTVVYDFGEGRGTAVNKFKIYNGSYPQRNPYVWRFEGSNDNSVWTTLHNVGEYTPNETGDWLYVGSVSEAWKGDTGKKTSVEYSFENETPYRYYRFVFIKTNASYCELKQLEFFNTNPGELHVNVPSGETTNSTVAISGNVKVVKEGLGTFIPRKTGQTYTGGTEIVAGTVKADTIGVYSGGYAFGPAGSKIIVSTNATSVGAFDVNGQARYGGYDFVLNGGMIKNSAPLAATSGKLGNVTLTADSAFDFTATGDTWCGFYNPGAAPNLDLRGNTLSLSSATFVDVENTKVISEGTIRVNSGLLQFYGRNRNVYTNDLTKAALELSPNAQMVLRIPGDNPMVVNLGDYICNTASADTGHEEADYQKATPKVYGTFKPNTDYFHGVELQDGATIDLSGRTTALPLRGLQYPSAAATATSLHTVTFAAPEELAESITIYVKLGERGAHGKLISWDSIPSGVNFVSASGEKERSFLVTDRGLSLSTGFMIILQ